MLMTRHVSTFESNEWPDRYHQPGHSEAAHAIAKRDPGELEAVLLEYPGVERLMFCLSSSGRRGRTGNLEMKTVGPMPNFLINIGWSKGLDVLLKHRRGLGDTCPYNNHTPLGCAVVNDRPASVKKLIANGGDPGKDGFDGLLVRLAGRSTESTTDATRKKRGEIAKLLLGQGANPAWRKGDGEKSAIEHACGKNNHYVAMALLENCDPGKIDRERLSDAWLRELNFMSSPAEQVERFQLAHKLGLAPTLSETARLRVKWNDDANTLEARKDGREGALDAMFEAALALPQPAQELELAAKLFSPFPNEYARKLVARLEGAAMAASSPQAPRPSGRRRTL